MVGLDLSAPMLSQAGAGFGGPLVQASLTLLPFTDRAFSGIWCAASLLHLQAGDALAALRETLRVTRWGGVAFFTVKTGDGAGVDATGRFFTYWTSEEFTDLVNTAGWTVIASYGSKSPGTDWVNVFAVRDR